MIPLQPAPKANRKEFPFVGFVRYQGIPIAIENRKGSTRSGVDKDGHAWRVRMNAHYGEVWGWGTRGVDGDKVDVYILEDPDAPLVYAVDQMRPDTGEFDEQKFILGAKSKDEAVALYRSQYDNPKFLGKVTEIPIARFKTLLRDQAKRGQRLHKAITESRSMKRTPAGHPLVVIGSQARVESMVRLSLGLSVTPSRVPLPMPRIRKAVETPSQTTASAKPNAESAL